MAVSYVGQASALTTSVTLAAHNVGDLMVMFAFATTSTPPTAPAGWTSLHAAGTGNAGSRLAYRIAPDTSTASGTWTGAAFLGCQIYRGAIIGAFAASNGTSVSQTYPALTLWRQDNSSWGVRFAGANGQASTGGTITGYTDRIANTARGLDTTAPVSTGQLSAVKTLAGSASWTTYTLEVTTPIGHQNSLLVPVGRAGLY